MTTRIFWLPAAAAALALAATGCALDSSPGTLAPHAPRPESPRAGGAAAPSETAGAAPVASPPDRASAPVPRGGRPAASDPGPATAGRPGARPSVPAPPRAGPREPVDRTPADPRDRPDPTRPDPARPDPPAEAGPLAGVELHGVWVSPAGTVWAVGAGGHVVTATDADIAVTVLPGTPTLRAIAGRGESHPVAVGDAGAIWHGSPSGWESADATEAQGSLEGVWVSSDGDSYVAFAVGAGGAVLRGDGTLSGWWKMYAFADGQDVTADLHGVWGADPWTAFAVGDGGRILQYNGKHWAALDSGTTADLHAIAGRSGTDVIALGDGVVVRFDGVSWTATALAPAFAPASAWMGASGAVLAVGGDAAASWTPGDPDWEPAALPADTWLTGVSGSRDTAWASGLGGTRLPFDLPEGW